MPGIIRFGNFEVDARAGELRRGGIRLKLSGQPFDVLLALLDKPGQLVTREELHEKLWSQDTFVDFEHGLNKAINKLRDALGDDADNPRFIETLPRRGYRFVAPVVGPDPANANVENAPIVRPEEKYLASTSIPLPAGAARPQRRIGLWVSVGAILIIVIAAAVVAAIPPHPLRVFRYTQLTHDGLSKSQNPVLVNDGSRVYFTEETDTGFVIGQVPVSGGEVTHVPLPFEDKILGICDISPDRTEFLLSSWRGWWKEDPLWVMPTTGGSARRVGNLTASFAAWSPDGNSIFYSTETGLYKAKTDGSDPQLLLQTKGIGGPVRVSPDRKTVRFETMELDSDTHHYWEASVDGSSLHLLFPDDSHSPSCCGVWSADGKDFFFNRNAQTWAFREPPKIFGKRIFGSTQPLPMQLTDGPIQFVYPSPSPDGQRLFAVGTQLRGELVRYDSKSDQFVSYLSGVSAWGLDFSRDGQWVVYVSYPDGAMWRSLVDGSEKQQLLNGSLNGFLPRWSPDGKEVAFTGRKPGDNWKVYTIPTEGGTPQSIDDGRDKERDPTWSPDGNSVAVGGEYDEKDATIRIVDLKAHKVSDLPNSKGLFSPRWSPDGRYIAALVNSTQGSLMLFEFRTGKWTQLAKGHAYGWHNWSHDGRYIYFSDPFEKDPGVPFYRVRVPDGKLERVAVANFPHGIDAADGWWTGLAPGDAPICLRDTGVQEIYALEIEPDSK